IRVSDEIRQSSRRDQKRERRPGPAPVKPRMGVAQERDRRQKRRHPKRDVNLPETCEEPRRRNRDKEPAGSAAGRDRQVEGSESLGRRPRTRQLAVTRHAARKERRRVSGHLRADRNGEAAIENERGPAQREGERGTKDRARIDAVAFKAEDE